MSEQQESRDEQEQETIYATWAADALDWKAAQDAWEHYMDELADRVQREQIRMEYKEVPFPLLPSASGNRWIFELQQQQQQLQQQQQPQQQQQEHMTSLERVREREIGGKWLYELWMEVVLSEGISPHARTLLPGWEKQHEKFRECYRCLWDRISEGFAARTQ